MEVLSNFTSMRDILKFAIYCAKDVKYLMDTNGKKILNSPEITEVVREGGIPGVRIREAKTPIINERDPVLWSQHCRNAYDAAGSAKAAIKETTRRVQFASDAANYAAWARAWDEHPEGWDEYSNLVDYEERRELHNRYMEEYTEIARMWYTILENPSNSLLGLSRSKDFDHLIYDMLQDDDDLRDTLIPWNGKEYYLNVHGYTDRFMGLSQDSVIDQIKRSPEKDQIIGIIRRMVR